MKKMLIKNGKVLNVRNDSLTKADIYCEDGVIKQVVCREFGNLTAPDMPEENDDVTVIDASGLIVSPGLVDGHVHFRDPGLTYKEDILTGGAAAAKGGFTTVIMMANTKPVIDNEETLEYCINKGKETGIKVLSSACITKGMKGQELTDMEALKAKGAVCFTDDGLPLLDEEVAKAAMSKAGDMGVVLSFHEENPAFIENNGVNRGKASEHFGIGGSPREAEIDMITRDIKLASETGAAINIQHISTKEGVDLVRKAKETGAEIYAEATPHHFTLTEDAVIKHGTLAKMNPPLRTEEDRKAIVYGIHDGTIDMIATDHAPHSAEEKAQDITKAPSGIIGLETSLSLAITTLVHKEKVNICKVLKAMSYNPARIYGLRTGVIEPGYPADFVIFDEYGTVTYDHFVSKATNSPFTGETLDGKICYTVCDGNIVYNGLE